MKINFLLLMALLIGSGVSSIHAQESSGFLGKAIEYANPRMVKVYGAGAGRVEGFATGIVVSDDGRIITSQGVYLDGKQVKVVVSDGTEFAATILKRDRKSHLGLLKIEAQTPDFFELSEEPVGAKGDWVVALTNAFKVADKEEPLSATLGVISLRTTMEARLTKRDVAYRGELVLIDAITSNPGASGGAVLTTNGKLVGTVGKIISSSETNTRLNYAVPVSTLKKFMDTKDDPIAVEDDAAVQAKQDVEMGIVLFKFGGRNNPAYVDRIKRGSPAAKAKVKVDDMVVSIAGNKIGTVRDYERALDQLRPEEEILIMVKRGVEIIRIRITPRAKESK